MYEMTGWKILNKPDERNYAKQERRDHIKEKLRYNTFISFGNERVLCRLIQKNAVTVRRFFVVYFIRKKNIFYV